MISAALNYIRSTQIWNSIFRHGIPRDRRTRVMSVMANVFLHLHPVAVRKSGIRLSFTWCMGGLTFFLFLAETINARHVKARAVARTLKLSVGGQPIGNTAEVCARCTYGDQPP